VPEMNLLLLYARPYATQVMNRCPAIPQTRLQPDRHLSLLIAWSY
jgi:hypothetical protein